jgi:L-iditol 2-dehydrogenase
VNARMKAAVLYGREDVRIEKIAVPAASEGEILLRTRVALTCGTDVKVFRRGYHARMIRPPAVFGHEVAGVVEEVGEGVDGLVPGTPVVVANSAPCGECRFCRAGSESLCDDLLFWNGAYAEFARIPARIVRHNVLPLEEGLGFRQAAMVEPLACVVRGIEESGVHAGQTVAVVGTGPVGLMLVRLAVLRGASVVAVGRNPGRLARARALGASETVTHAPGTSLGARLASLGPHGHGPDVVIEAVGQRETAEAALSSVRKGGLVNLFAGCPADASLALDAQRLHYQELTIKSTFHHTPQSIRKAYRMIADGEVDPLQFITAEAPLEALPEELRRLAAGGDGLKTAILTWGSE